MTREAAPRRRERSDAFRLQVGDILQLQIPDDDQRLAVRVIGYLPEQSVIVSAPQAGGKVLLVREGQVYIARMLVGNRVYGFNAVVLRACSRPYSYLHLSYPSEVASLQVRTANRIRTELIVAVRPAAGEGGQEPLSATMIDISLTGAQINARERLGREGDDLAVAVRVQIAGVEYAVTLQATIRNVTQKESGTTGDGYVHGVQFHDIPDGERLVLHGFVYQQWVAELTA